MCIHCRDYSKFLLGKLVYIKNYSVLRQRLTANFAMQQTLDSQAERGLRPQPTRLSSVPDGRC